MTNIVYYVKRGVTLFGPYSYDQVTNCIRRDIFKPNDQISADKITWVSIFDFQNSLAEQNKNNISAPAPIATPAVQHPEMNAPAQAMRAPARKIVTRPVRHAHLRQATPYYEQAFEYQDVSYQRHHDKIKSMYIASMISFFIYLGIGLFSLLLVAIGIDIEDDITAGFGIIVNFLNVIIGIVFFVFECILLYRIWNVIPRQDTTVTPGKAVGFLFIPFFNLYWFFVAYYGAACEINRQCAKQKMYNVVSEPVVLLLSISIYGLVLINCIIGFVAQNTPVAYFINEIFSLMNTSLFASIILIIGSGAMKLAQLFADSDNEAY